MAVDSSEEKQKITLNEIYVSAIRQVGSTQILLDNDSIRFS